MPARYRNAISCCGVAEIHGMDDHDTEKTAKEILTEIFELYNYNYNSNTYGGAIAYFVKLTGRSKRIKKHRAQKLLDCFLNLGFVQLPVIHNPKTKNTITTVFMDWATYDRKRDQIFSPPDWYMERQEIEKRIDELNRKIDHKQYRGPSLTKAEWDELDRLNNIPLSDGYYRYEVAY